MMNKLFCNKKINTSGYAQDGWNYLFLKLKVIIRIKMYNFKFHICFFVQRTIIGIYLRERKLNFSYTYFCDMHRVNTLRFPDIVVLVWLGFFCVKKTHLISLNFEIFSQFAYKSLFLVKLSEGFFIMKINVYVYMYHF